MKAFAYQSVRLSISNCSWMRALQSIQRQLSSCSIIA